MRAREIHMWWTIAILVVLVIVTLTVKLGGVEGLLERLSFAVTVASLVLATVAIALALFSGYSFSRNVDELNKSSGEITGSAGKLTEATGTLAQKIEAMPEQVGGVVDERVESALTQLLGDRGGDEASETSFHAETLKEHLLNRSPIAGIHTMLFLAYAHEAERTVDLFLLDRLASGHPIVAGEYRSGYPTGFMYALVTLRFVVIEEGGGSSFAGFRVIHIGVTTEELWNALNRGIDAFEGSGLSEQLRTSNLEQIKAMEAFFGLHPDPDDPTENSTTDPPASTGPT